MIAKRIFDLVSSALGLAILAPLLLMAALWIKADSPGPVFFRQTRIGRHGKPFKIHKFRTMIEGGDALGPQITVGTDARITTAGRLLRQYKIDELPQLIDVLIGNMSMVGPRPELPKYVEVYAQDLRAVVLSLRPGITDDASIEFRNESELLGRSTDPEKTYVEEILPRKLAFYVRYVRERSFLGDMQIIGRTLRAIVAR